MAWSENAKGQQTAKIESITSSTDASPIVITKTSHGFNNGDIIHVMDHAVNTNANGRYVVANVTANTLELQGSTATGGGAGGATGVKAKEFTLADITAPAGKTLECRVDYFNLVNGEWGELITYIKVHGTSGTLRIFDIQTFAHAPGDGPAVAKSLPIPGLNNVKFALVQRIGTARQFNWDIAEIS